MVSLLDGRSKYCKSEKDNFIFSKHLINIDSNCKVDKKVNTDIYLVFWVTIW